MGEPNRIQFGFTADAGAAECRQVGYKTTTEIVNVGVSFADVLASGESLTGSPTVTVTGVTVTNATVSTATHEINGVEVAAGASVLFTLTGGTANTAYVVSVSTATDANVAQTLIANFRIHVRADV